MSSSSPNVKLNHLRAFLAAAQELHFTRAAARMHMGQQVLSQQIRQLELTLGVTLFARTTRKVELTPAGEALRVHAERVLHALDRAFADVQQIAAGESSVLRIAYSPAFVEQANHLRDTIRSTQAEMRFTLLECWTDQAIQGVEEGRYHAAVLYGEESPVGLPSRAAPPTKFGVAVSLDDPLAGEPDVTADDLADRTLAIWQREQSPLMYDFIHAALGIPTGAGRTYEYENFSHGLIFHDLAAREQLREGRAFSVATPHQVEVMGGEFAWVPLRPPAALPARLFYPGDSTSSTLVRVVLEAAEAAWGPANSELVGRVV